MAGRGDKFYANVNIGAFTSVNEGTYANVPDGFLVMRAFQGIFNALRNVHKVVITKKKFGIFLCSPEDFPA